MRRAKLGIIILVHQNVDRAMKVAEFLCDQGAIIHIHFDKRSSVTLPKSHKNLKVSNQFACEWGGFGLVDASLSAAKDLLAHSCEVTHIALLSESCVPTRPLEELISFLENHPDTDFITTKPLAEEGWIGDGLSTERLTLFHPFSYRKRRFLFDLSVRIQRILGVSRKLPTGFSPSIGDQWWLLSRASLQDIFNHQKFEAMKRFMRSAWISDELFFQTMLSALPNRKILPSLTFVEFDRLGKPYTFYDDHLELLKKNRLFFARKIWPKANRIYEHFLLPYDVPKTPIAIRMRRKGVQAARHVTNLGQVLDVRARSYQLTDKPFYIFVGFSQAMPNFRDWLEANFDLCAMALVYSRSETPKANLTKGNQLISPQMLRYNPHAVTANILAQDYENPPALILEPGGNHGMWSTFLRSPKANIVFLEDHWKGRLNNKIRSHQRLQRVQSAYGKLLNRDLLKSKRAIMTVVSWSSFTSDPLAAFEAVALKRQSSQNHKTKPASKGGHIAPR
ncbi:MAG: beta-1,6-N-acetylglucosaminyltransferase [Pseudomonadota bacterium]